MKHRTVLDPVFLLIMMAILFVSLADEADGKTITVDDDGRADFSSIQDAINASEDGDTIRVYAGSYFEPVTVNKSIRLIGNGSEVTRVIGDGTGVGIGVTASNANISGFNISGWEHGIFISFVAGNNTISNNAFISCKLNLNAVHGNTIHNNSFVARSDEGGSEILLYVSRNNRLINNELIHSGISIVGSGVEEWITNQIGPDNTVNGKPVVSFQNMMDRKVPEGAGQIIVVNCTNVTIEDQNCSNGSIGISIAFSNNISVAGSSAISNWGFNFYIYHSQNIVVFNNTFNKGGTGIFSDKVKNVSIEHNTFTGNDVGIRLRDCEAAKLRNNLITMNRIGIYLGNKMNRVENNTISLNTEHGILLANHSKNNIVERNDIVENNIGIYHSKFAQESDVSFNTISMNREYGVFSAGFFHLFTLSATNNWWGHTSGPHHPSENPGGQGDNITDFVLFQPWLDEHGNHVRLPDEDVDDSPSHLLLSFLLLVLILLLIVLVVVTKTTNRR